MSDCLFCKIAAGEIPSNKVYEDELVYAFYDIDPQAPTHFLVIPKAHIGSCGEISPENSAVVAHAFEVISQVTKELGITDFRVVSNCGEQAGQSVHHLHFHVLAGRRHLSMYDTPYGALSVGINTRKMRAELDARGGSIEIDYAIEIDHALAGQNLFRIHVREKGPAIKQ